MREILLWICFVFCFRFGLSQDSRGSTLSTEIKIGPSIPFGKFANKNYSQITNSNGLAKIGFGLDLNVKFTLNKSFGLQISGGYSSNKQDPQAIENNITKGALNPIETRVATNNWAFSKILAGFYLDRLSKNPKLSFGASVSGGIFKTSVPAYDWSTYSQSGILLSGMIADKSSLPWSFCFQISPSLTYSLTDKLYWLFCPDYFNGFASSHSSSLNYYFASVNIKTGIGYKF